MSDPKHDGGIDVAVDGPYHNDGSLGIPCYEYAGGLSFRATARFRIKWPAKEREQRGFLRAFADDTGMPMFVYQHLTMYLIYTDASGEVCPAEVWEMKEAFKVPAPTNSRSAWSDWTVEDNHFAGMPYVGLICDAHCIQKAEVIGKLELRRRSYPWRPPPPAPPTMNEFLIDDIRVTTVPVGNTTSADEAMKILKKKYPSAIQSPDDQQRSADAYRFQIGTFGTHEEWVAARISNHQQLRGMGTYGGKSKAIKWQYGYPSEIEHCPELEEFENRDVSPDPELWIGVDTSEWLPPGPENPSVEYVNKWREAGFSGPLPGEMVGPSGDAPEEPISSGAGDPWQGSSKRKKNPLTPYSETNQIVVPGPRRDRRPGGRRERWWDSQDYVVLKPRHPLLPVHSETLHPDELGALFRRELGR